MKINKLIVVASLFVGSFAQAQDPTADQIIDKYLTAIGGKENIAKVQDLVINTAAETQRGTIETEVKFKAPNKYTSITYMMGNEVNRTICNGSKVQISSNFGGNVNDRVLEGADAVTAMLQTNPFPEMLYDQLKIKRAVTGKDTVAGKLAWKVGFETEDGKKWSESFDAETGLKVKRSMAGGMGMGGNRQGGQGGVGGQAGGGGQRQPGEGGGNGGQGGGQRQGGMGGNSMRGGGGSFVFSDYKEIKEGAGVKIPFVREMGGGPFATKTTVSSLKVNKGVKDNAFEIK